MVLSLIGDGNAHGYELIRAFSDRSGGAYAPSPGMIYPLLTLLAPADRNTDIVNSLIAAQQVSPYGILPVWSFHGQETWTMIGYHAVPVIADRVFCHCTNGASVT